SGLIRLAATLGFGRLWLGPALADFQRKHPRVQFQLQLTEQLPDLAAEGFDGAIWLWAARGTGTAQWVSRRLARNQRVLVASPAYLVAHGTPRDVQALSDHQCIVVRENARLAGPRFGVWPLQHERDKTSAHVRVQGALSANSGELARDWALQGHGIALRSLWDIAPQLERGELVRVLPGWAMTDADIHWLAPWQPRTPRRMRLLVDFLAERFRNEPWQPAPIKPVKTTAEPVSRPTRAPAARRGSRRTP
ncbi:MAG: LysR family transcriptional regulator, partial [Rubrivivax sp.]